MASELELASQNIFSAKTPEDIFGKLQGSIDDQLEALKRVYRKLALITHEDRYLDPSEQKLAGEAFRLLNNLNEKAEARIRAGVYGKRSEPTPDPQSKILTFSSRGYTFQVLNRIHSGGTCGIFEGVATDSRSQSSDVIFRVPHLDKDNDLMEREVKHLGLIKDQIKVLSKTPEGQKVATGLALRLPILMQSIRLSEPSSRKRKVVNIFLKLPGQESGWFTLEQIRNQYPDGVSTRIMVFIWNRILEGLTLSHYSGIVHGAITPNHVLIQAANHSGNIIDWTSSCRTKEGDKVPYVDSRYQAFFPPEVLVHNQSPTFSADIYMSALSMVYILGGDPEKMIIPSGVEGPIRDFINRCLQPKISRRPKDAQVAWGEFRQVAKEVFGRREFVQLVMPTA